MSSFEFLSVLISVVVGLGMTHLLTGAGSLLHGKNARLSRIHGTWTVFVFFFLVIYWWTVVFGWQEQETWNILLFLFVLVYGVLLYLLCVVLYPVMLPDVWDLQEHFLTLRGWFFGIWMLTLVAELADTYLKGHFDDLAPPYIPLVVSWFLMSIWGWRSANAKHQFVIAVYHLMTLVVWVAIQLADLEWAVAG